MQLSNEMVDSIVREVLGRLSNGHGGSVATASTSTSGLGVYAEAGDAISAARQAYGELRKKGYAARSKIVEVVKQLCAQNAQAWGKLELDETKIGRLEHKVAKLQGIPGIPGVEFLSPLGISGDHGITMEENAPFGVIAAITPVTHSIPTIAANIISMVAAGNTIVVNAHPSGAKCAAVAVAAFNAAIERETGLRNVITIIEKPTLESFKALCDSPEIDLICVTGGPHVVKAAMKSGKRAICAGPGNPPVVVDRTADLKRAAKDIILGGGFDNNLLCIGEKQVFVEDAVYQPFLKALAEAGAARLNDQQLDTLTKASFKFEGGGVGCGRPTLNRDVVGVDASILAEKAGLKVPSSTMILFAETDFDHPYVQEEQMMPMIPIVRARNVDEAIDMAYRSEHGYKHSAIIHSRDIEVITRMGRLMDCTLFVKNGPSIAGLGMGGEGYASFSIATATGEGITTAMTFTRKRRCVMVDQLNII